MHIHSPVLCYALAATVAYCTHTHTHARARLFLHTSVCYQGDMYEEDYKYSSAANPAPIHYAVDQQNLQGPGAGLRYCYTLL
jgi:hypothetical protein